MERLIELLRHARLKLYEEDLRLCDDQNTVSRLGGAWRWGSKESYL